MKRRAVVLIIICIVGLCLHFSRLICTTDAQILLYTFAVITKLRVAVLNSSEIANADVKSRVEIAINIAARLITFFTILRLLLLRIFEKCAFIVFKHLFVSSSGTAA